MIEQIPLRKDWPKGTSIHKKGPNDMDVDAAQAEKLEHDNVDYQCWPCENGEDLDTLKGVSRTTFHGYCSCCNIWGHKRAEYRKRLADSGGKDGKAGKRRLQRR